MAEKKGILFSFGARNCVYLLVIASEPSCRGGKSAGKRDYADLTCRGGVLPTRPRGERSVTAGVPFYVRDPSLRSG